MEMEKDKIIAATEMAAASDVVKLTCDRIEALAGGHGMLNLAIFSVANVITEELLRGESLHVKFANARRLPVDDIIEKGIKTAKRAGADSANAALITATLMYFAGAEAQVGVPAGNRKLGATARMLAGVDRCGVSNIPTGKMNSKISGFPAVAAINQAMMDGTLSRINGRDIPEGVFGAVYGHSALGEDYIWPSLAENGARIGTQAMLDAMAGAGIRPNALYASVLGAAAILEIIHPDAEVPESEGKYGRTSSAYLVGRSAARTAGLPDKLHLRLTDEEFDTYQVIGDMGLILKDVGGPSVVGMIAFSEILQAFREFSTGFHNSPLGHMTPYIMAAMKALSKPDANKDDLARRLIDERNKESLDPENTLVCINIVARKAAELLPGPVTQFLINATEPIRTKAIYDRAVFTYEQLTQGVEIDQIARVLDDRRVAVIEHGTAVCFKNRTGDDVTLKFTKLDRAARRTGKVVQKYLAFDPLVNIDLTVNEKHAVIEHFTDRFLPEASMKQHPDLVWAASYATPATAEIMNGGNNLLNIIVPVCVCAIMGIHTPEEAAVLAEPACYITCAIPGGKANASAVGKLAKQIYEFLSHNYER